MSTPHALLNKLVDESLSHLPINQLLTIYSQDARLCPHYKGVIMSRFQVEDFYLLASPADANPTEIAYSEPRITNLHPLGWVFLKGYIQLMAQLLQCSLHPLYYLPDGWMVLAHAIWCRHPGIFQQVVWWLPIGELIINSPPQLLIQGFLPGGPDYVYLTTMGYKHDALTVLLTHHTPHQQPPYTLVCKEPHCHPFGLILIS
ncbi:hypothetical protein BDW71DRAFT_212838 [Aspergillus fruticulosus]